LRHISAFHNFQKLNAAFGASMKLVLAGVVAYFFARFFMDFTYLVHALYERTTISKILPFVVVILGFWFLLCVFFCILLVALKNIQLGLNFIIFVLPMSALPFILVGVPQIALNHVFICRSSILFFASLLFFSWFLQNVLVFKERVRLPLLSHLLVFLALYAGGVLHVENMLKASLYQSMFVLAVCGAFFYFVIAWIKDQKRLLLTLRVMAVSCIVQAVLSFFTYYYYVVLKGSDSFSFTGLLRDYELFAEYLAIHIPIFVFLVRNENDRFWRRIYAGGLLLIVFVLFATVIRGAIGAIFVAMLYYFHHLRKVTSVAATLKSMAVLLAVFAVGLLAVYLLVPESANIIERFIETDLRTGDSRRTVWLMFFDYFRERPLFGHGMFYNLPTSGLFWPHSTYFYYVLTIGIAGLANYLLLLMRLVARAGANLKINRRDPLRFEMALALNASLIVFILDGLKVGYLRYSSYQLFIWILFGLIVALHQMKRINNGPVGHVN
jgi:O-antigen ligase